MINTARIGQTTLSQNHSRIDHQSVRRVLGQVLTINLLVAVAKIIAGIMAGSISMIADGFHSAMDASSNVIGIVGSTVASHPPDRNHPYGHHKYETFAMLGIGLLLLLTSWNVLRSIVLRLVNGTTPEITTLTFAVMICTILLNFIVVVYEKWRAEQLRSNLLRADAAHTKSDIFVSFSVIASLIAVKFGWFWIDVAVALIIVAVIGHTGWKIVRRASEVLADGAVIDVSMVEHVVCSIEGVHSCHKIRSRGPRQAAHLDLHIQVDGQMSLEAAHHLGHIAQDRLKKDLGAADVMVHVEPVDLNTPPAPM